jgi:hypothetical protein
MAQENINPYDVINTSGVEVIKKSLKIIVSRLGINVDFDLSKKKIYDGRFMVSVKSTAFQTMPVIYKSICIEGSGLLIRDTDKEGILYLSIPLSYHFDYFGGGTNGVNIGVCRFIIFADTKRVVCNGLTLSD